MITGVHVSHLSPSVSSSSPLRKKCEPCSRVKLPMLLTLLVLELRCRRSSSPRRLPVLLTGVRCRRRSALNGAGGENTHVSTEQKQFEACGLIQIIMNNLKNEDIRTENIFIVCMVSLSTYVLKEI